MGRYVLLRTPLRPEAFAPPGGVLKFHAEAKETLDSLEFRPHVPAGSQRGLGDLRGFVQMMQLPGLLRWYSRGLGREAHSDALRRELREELEEVGLPALAGRAASLGFRRVRRVVEGPSPVPGHAHLQLRIFEVFEPTESSSPELMGLCHDLLAAAASNPNVVAASDNDIWAGRSGDRVISHHSQYLLGLKIVRSDLPALEL